MSDISLKSIIKESATIEEDFPGYPGFVITLAYPGRQQLNKIRKAASHQKMNRKTHQVEDVLDDEKFLHKFVEAVIKGWKGFKVSYLQELALVDAEGLNSEDEVPFSVENALVLMENSPDFDSFITDMTTDMENFTKPK